MIAYIKGKVVQIEEERLILESGNMGYNIMMPSSSLEERILIQDEVKIYTHLHVREDAMQLYGFLSQEELKTFRLLLGVNGIGPKAALGILSGLTVDELRFAVLSDDIKTISKAPGIGKKTAQKLILELKDKIDLAEAFDTKQIAEKNENKAVGVNDATKDAVEALSALGYSSTEALRAVRQAKIEPDMDVEAILKLALKNMSL